MYTKGIRKILISHCLPGTHIEEFEKIADKTGYNAFEFNGEIYIKNQKSNQWLKSPFTIEDFSDA